MDYEIVQKHEYQDIYRLTYGVLVIVNKFKHQSQRNWYWNHTKDNKKKLKKITGLKNCFMTNEDIEIRSYITNGNEVVPIGSIIFEDAIILPTTIKEDYYFELKTTGSCFSGLGKEFNKLLETAKEIYNLY